MKMSDPMLDPSTLTGFDQHNSRIERHYLAALAEHPHFCDSMLPKCETKEDDDAIVSQIKSNIAFFRQRMEKGNELHNLMWNEILCLKVWEATNLIHNGDTAASVEKLYEGVAVLLRAIDVIEGRQKLGKPKKRRTRCPNI